MGGAERQVIRLIHLIRGDREQGGREETGDSSMCLFVCMYERGFVQAVRAMGQDTRT